jgi:hypothetical protein
VVFLQWKIAEIFPFSKHTIKHAMTSLTLFFKALAVFERSLLQTFVEKVDSELIFAKLVQ